MFNFKRLLYTSVGKIIISIILGLGFASLFRKACHERDCITFNGPIIDQVKGRVFQYGDECYKYTPRATTCKAEGKNGENVKIIEVAPAPTPEEGGKIPTGNEPIAKPVKVTDLSGNKPASSGGPSLFGIFGGGGSGTNNGITNGFGIFGGSGQK